MVTKRFLQEAKDENITIPEVKKMMTKIEKPWNDPQNKKGIEAFDREGPEILATKNENAERELARVAQKLVENADAAVTDVEASPGWAGVGPATLEDVEKLQALVEEARPVPEVPASCLRQSRL